MRLFVDGLASLAAEVDLLFFVPPGTDTSYGCVREHEADLRESWHPRLNLALCPRTSLLPSSGSAVGRLRTIFGGVVAIQRQTAYAPACGTGPRAAIGASLSRHPSLVFVHDLRAMSPLLGWSTPLPPVFDIDNIDHRLQLRRLLRSPGWPAERLRLSWIPALLLGELRAYRLARRVFVCSERDERYLHRLGVRQASTIPNAVDVPTEPPAGPGPPRALFLGSLNYRPNAEAAEYLISRIWPAVAAAVPQAELWVAGRDPEHVRGFDNPTLGVRFLGFVGDLQGSL